VTPLLGSLLLASVAFVAMEPVTYGVHRFVMHGPGLVWHRSHHARSAGRFERNDLFPVVFASVTIAAMAAGSQIAALALLLPIGAGVSAYGLAYLLVHDGYIHRRLPGAPRRRLRGLDRLADAHALHHRFGAEPYGMLLPVVPARLRERAAARAVDHRRALGVDERVA
jgi:beta-carotene 3-hydroxylase